MYVDNNWYSHREVLAEYCETGDQMILESIQHGVHISDYYSDNIGKPKLFFSKHLCWDRKYYEYCKSRGNNKIIPIGAPFLYLDNLLKNKKYKPALGTLVFPAHNNPGNNRGFKHDLFIKKVMESHPGPYTACIFFLDYNERTINIYKKYNWKTVTCGNRTNSNFLKNLYGFLKKQENIVVTELGSTIFYSLYLNKKTSYLYKCKINNETIYFSDHTHPLNIPYDIFTKQINEYKNKNYFLLEKIINSNKGKELADIELGKEFFKTKDQLKKIIKFDNYLRKFFAIILSKFIDLKHKNMREWKK